jgi:hypothetical protein
VNAGIVGNAVNAGIENAGIADNAGNAVNADN